MAKLNFKNKWVLVTGASSGLGKSIAEYLASREKANLVIVARRKDRLEKLKEDIETNYGTKVECLVADLSDEAHVERLFKESVEIGDIYAVVNNAGYPALLTTA
jgi:short-subunit dehydrogenase